MEKAKIIKATVVCNNHIININCVENFLIKWTTATWCCVVVAKPFASLQLDFFAQNMAAWMKWDASKSVTILFMWSEISTRFRYISNNCLAETRPVHHTYHSPALASPSDRSQWKRPITFHFSHPNTVVLIVNLCANRSPASLAVCMWRASCLKTIAALECYTCCSLRCSIMVLRVQHEEFLVALTATAAGINVLYMLTDNSNMRVSMHVRYGVSVARSCQKEAL